MELSVEYLIIIEKSAIEALYHLCDSIKEFNKLLQTNSDIVIKQNRVRYKQSLECGYVVTTGQITGKDQRFFHTKLTFDGDEAQIGEFTDLLREIKGIIHRAGVPPETLWDDVSLYYLQKAYPLIHKVENLMRKLITYFMLTNVGKQWVTENIPEAIQDALQKSKRKQYLDILHQVDFIHLGDFLFKPYSTRTTNEMFDELIAIQRPEDLDLDELRAFIPRSNWDRYFSDRVECDDRFIKARWEELYELRCKVAHNAIIVKGDYDRIVDLVDQVVEKLQKAIDNLDKVHVPEEDKEQVADNVASNISILYGEFIQSWRQFEATLNRIASYVGFQPALPGRPLSPRQIIQDLHRESLIDDETLEESRLLIDFRNLLVHDANLIVDERKIQDYIQRLDRSRESILGSVSETSGRGSWRDEVANALCVLGGKAVLSSIYDYIQQNTLRDLPETWRATVRYTLLINSSDSKVSSRGGKDIFARLGRGYWGLKENVILSTDE